MLKKRFKVVKVEKVLKPFNVNFEGENFSNEYLILIS